MSSRIEPGWISAVDEIYHDRWAAGKLLRIRLLRRSIGQFWPEGHPARLVHVAGTNGKGSVCRLLEAALGSVAPAGAMVNPHLFDFAERFSLRGRFAEHRELAALWRERVRPHSLDRAEGNLDHALSFAEAGILLALLLFEAHGLRYGVLETGVGGRYAPTMALDPALCLLSDVGDDHPRTLGKALWQRALEKAGIARRGVPLLTAATGEALEVVAAAAAEEGAPLTVVGAPEAEALRRRAGALEPPPAPRPEHAWRNAALALAGARLLEPSLDEEAALRALLAAPPLPGRFWRVRPGLIADVAHNPDKLAALARQLEAEEPGRPLRLVFGVSRGRALEPMLAPLLPRLHAVLFTRAGYAGRPPGELLRDYRLLGAPPPAAVIEEPAEALARAEAERRDPELVLLTGSAYSIDQALNPDRWLRTLNAEYGRRGAPDDPVSHLPGWERRGDSQPR
jgi:dihydrofolate synthase / folylpolyglutamate synthase